MNQLHEQQVQFKDAHKTVEGLVRAAGMSEQTFLPFSTVTDGRYSVCESLELQRARNVNPGELRREIQQLEEEKSQLTEKIAQRRTRTSGVVRVS